MLRNALDPILSQILSNLIQIGAVLLFTAAGFLWRMLHKYLQTHLNAKQLELLQFLGNQAYTLAETEFRDLHGSQKLQKAMDFLQKEATQRGIPFNESSARAAIEHAWLTFSSEYKSTQSSSSTLASSQTVSPSTPAGH